MKASNETKKPLPLWDNTPEITRRFALGVREVVRDHALAGNPVAVWRDGKAVMLSPEEIFAELRCKRKRTPTPETQ